MAENVTTLRWEDVAFSGREDTWIGSDAQTTNHEGEVTAKVGAVSVKGGGTDLYNVLIQAPLTGTGPLPAWNGGMDYAINYAKLRVTVHSGSGSQFTINAKVITAAWLSGSATWLQRLIFTNWDTPGGDFLESPIDVRSAGGGAWVPSTVLEFTGMGPLVTECLANQGEKFRVGLMAFFVGSPPGWVKFHARESGDGTDSAELEIGWTTIKSKLVTGTRRSEPGRVLNPGKVVA